MLRFLFPGLLLAFLVVAGCDVAPSSVPPEPPTLSAPANGSVDVATALELKWRPIADALTYEVEVSLSPDFASPLVHESGLGSAVYPLSRLGRSTTYYWRVRAEGSDAEGTWSPVWSFTPSREATVPQAPSLLYPEDGRRNMPTEIDFEWAAQEGAFSYDLQVGEEAEFLRREADLTGIRTTHRTLYDLEREYTYFWRVRATNPLGTGPWSEIRVLEVIW